MEKFNYKNIIQIPHINKIIINININKTLNNTKTLNKTIKNIHHITNQQPIITKTHKNITTFKLHKNHTIDIKNYTHIHQLKKNITHYLTIQHKHKLTAQIVQEKQNDE